VEEGKARGILKLEGFEGRVEVGGGGRRHVVKAVGWSTELEERQDGKTLLRIRIAAEIDCVKCYYTTTYGRYRKINAALGFATARAGAPRDRLADAERLAAVIKVLTGKEPRIIERSDGTIELECGREHLDGFKRYAELADTVGRWLEATSRR
jgi:hypothetical protein